jgi:hypothetical protein
MMLRWLWLTSLCLLDAAGLDELYDLIGLALSRRYWR